jgi:hypothetical protein
MRSKCTESKNCTKVVTRHVWADYLERAEDLRHSPQGKEVYARRKETIERVFGDMKEKRGGRYTHIRGLTREKGWVGLKFAAMNLKKLACWSWKASSSLCLVSFLLGFRCLHKSTPCRT